MGNMLDTPMRDKEGHSHTTDEGLFGHATGMQGYRLEMEDAHILKEIPDVEKHTILAVFDGHGGAGAAKYSAKHLLPKIIETDDWKAYVADDCSDHTHIGKALHTAFMAIDVDIRASQEAGKAQATDLQREVDTSGCTAVVCIVNEKYIICSNAGDSRSVMGIKDGFKEMSHDHKPMNIEERKRIEDAGGVVTSGRVDGNLAVSRAFGDFEFKDTRLAADKTKVTAKPEIIVHERTAEDDILILACDGVWDVFSSAECIQYVRELYESGEGDIQKIAEEVIEKALIKGSKDNISCVALKLPGAVIGDAANGGVSAIWSKREAEEKANEQKMHGASR